MNTRDKIEEYFATAHKFSKDLLRLREIIKKTPLVEHFKWNAPVYTLDGKNVIGLGRFKNHYGIWFFNGVLIDDPENLLENAQEGKTKALRQLKLTEGAKLEAEKILGLIHQAIKNEKAGKRTSPAKPKKKIAMPEELLTALDTDPVLKKSFAQLTPGKQREYADHITSAKQETTRQRRLKSAIPNILAGKGLYDKYKNC